MDFAELLNKGFLNSTRVQKRFERMIALSFKKTLQDVRAEVSAFYSKYAVNKKLTMDILVKSKKYPELERKIFDALEGNLSQTIATIKTSLPVQFYEGFTRTAYAFDTALKTRLGWKMPSSASVSKMFSTANLNNFYYTEAIKNFPIEAKRKVRQAVMNNITAGKSVSAMTEDLKKAVNFVNYKASLIVQTEGTAAINAGMNAVFLQAEDMGMKGQYVWNAVNDLRTRPDHAEMNGEVKQADGFYNGPGGERAPYPSWIGLSAGQRINCIPEDEVVIADDVEKIYRRWYEGDLVVIEMSNGFKFRVTPNHPILTDKGWITANLIDKGSNIVNVDFGEVLNQRNLYIKNSPPIISKVFNFFRVMSVNQWATGMHNQFHGDGGNGNVNIEYINSHLWNCFKSTFYKPSVQKAFSNTYFTKFGLAAYSMFYTIFMGMLLSTNCIMGCFSKLLSFFRGCICHPSKHSFRTISSRNLISNEEISECNTRDLLLFSQHLFGYSGKIFFNNVIGVSWVPYSGHVYNLQTKSGYYGLYHNNGSMSIVHNCRCIEVFQVDSMTDQLTSKVLANKSPAVSYKKWKEEGNASDEEG